MMFSQPIYEPFPQGIPGVIERPVALYATGLMKVTGRLWRCRLHELSCQTTLLPGQPAIAIAREGNVFIVIPQHCLLWTQYLEDFATQLTPTDIATLHHHEQSWRFS